MNNFNPNAFNTHSKPSHSDHSQRHQQGFTNVQHVRTRRLTTRSLYSIGFALGLLVIIVAALFLYNRGHHSDTIPIVHADPKPFKVRATAEETVIPHSEKTIYTELGSGETVNKVENLLEYPEKPQIQMPSLPDDFMAALSEGGDADGTVDAKSIELQNHTSVTVPSQNHDGMVMNDQPNTYNPVTSSHSHSNPVAESQSTFEDVTAVEPEPSMKEPLASGLAHDILSGPSSSDAINTAIPTRTIENTAPPTTMEVSSLKVKSSKLAAHKNHTVTTLADSYRIQLYSGVSQKNVSTYWKSLKQKSGGLLASYTPIVHKVDMGTVKGIHYRLQFGEFTKKEAFAFCSRLKERSIDCWPVKR